VLITIYIFIRFGNWSMGIGSVLAAVHDVLLTLAFSAAMNIEINSSFIAVILTIIGYSINDTVIVFDRVRENLRTFGEHAPLSQLANLSISQTILRTLNTIVSVIVMIMALLIFGGTNIRDFMLAMLIGILSGAYSSIYIATPLMLLFTRSKHQLLPAVETSVGQVAATPAALAAEREIETISETIRSAVERKQKASKKQRRR